MINIINESGEEKLPIDNLSIKEIMNRIKKLNKEAIKDEETYFMELEFN